MLIEAAIEVGPALFFSLLIITVSFLPIFALEAQEGRLFKPLAYTKTFAMAAAALLSVTLVPGADDAVRARPDHARAQEPGEPVSDLDLSAGDPVGASVQGRHHPDCPRDPRRSASGRRSKLGTEFMPNLNEGTLFYMPTHAAGPLGHQGGRAGADAGQDHQVVSRGRLGLGQGGTRLDGDRPCARPRCSRP